MAKKLQVFISSTYTDMKNERQGVVEAILECGHIPAGMELFAADSKEQFSVIKKWIRESDVFLLVLGGRYGSIESKSKKSYIQLEYEYAKHIGKKPIAILITDDGIKNKITYGDYSIEQKEYLQPEYKQFREQIEKGKLCDYFYDINSLKNCVVKALRNCEKNSGLIGWIKGSDTDNVQYPYVFEEQEFTFKYLDKHTIEYIKRFKIRMLVDGIPYFSDRYSWNAGGKISLSLANNNQKIIDCFRENTYDVYTVRLNEVSKKNSIYEISVKFDITNAKHIPNQHMNLAISFPAKFVKFNVMATNGLSISNCRYNLFSSPADRIPCQTLPISTTGAFAEKTIDIVEKGKCYGIEWNIG